MNRIKEESLAGKFQSSHSQADYDCELPPDVRTELFAPRRPRILGHKTQSRRNSRAYWPLYLVLLIAIVVVGGTIATRRQEPTAERTNKAISQPLAPQPTPIPIPTPEPTRSWQESSANNPPAPRAMLVQPRAPRATPVKLPTPRAQLVRNLPPLIPGQRYLATMPYGIEALTTYKGELASLDMLPTHRNQIGDMYTVGNVPWVWIWVPGAAHADWIVLSEWLRIAFAVFLSSETVPLMGLRSPGEFKHYAFERFRSILHMTVRNSLKIQSPIPDWAAEKIKESWNVQ